MEPLATPCADELRVLDGLTSPFKELPPKHLYDARGSQLFDAGVRTRVQRAMVKPAARTSQMPG